MFVIPQAEIIVKSCEVRTSINGDMYYLITTESGEIYGDWREGKEVEGEFPLKPKKHYKIEYTISRDGKYKNIRSAWIVKVK